MWFLQPETYRHRSLSRPIREKDRLHPSPTRRGPPQEWIRHRRQPHRHRRRQDGSRENGKKRQGRQGRAYGVPRTRAIPAMRGERNSWVVATRAEQTQCRPWRYSSALEPAFFLGEQATAARKIRLDTRTMDAPAGTSSFQATSRPPSQETTPNRAARKKRRPRR